MEKTTTKVKQAVRQQTSYTLASLLSVLLAVAGVSRWGAIGLRIVAEMSHHSRRLLRGS